jgi:hypothetical protein
LELEIIMLSKISQTQTNTECSLSYGKLIPKKMSDMSVTWGLFGVGGRVKVK